MEKSGISFESLNYVDESFRRQRLIVLTGNLPDYCHRYFRISVQKLIISSSQCLKYFQSIFLNRPDDLVKETVVEFVHLVYEFNSTLILTFLCLQ